LRRSHKTDFGGRTISDSNGFSSVGRFARGIGLKNLLMVTAGAAYAGLFSAPCLALEDASKPALCDKSHTIARQTPLGGFDFGTTSWVRPVTNAFAYWACIQNNEAQRQLFVNWHIPTVVGTIDPSDSISKPRVFSNRDTSDINGCLIYGNDRRVMKIQFMGTSGDLKDAQAEGDCSSLRGQQAAALPSNGIPNFLLDGRMTVPSNIEDVEHTLVRLVYEIGLSGDEKNFKMVFNYATAPTSPKSFTGNIRDLTIRPSNAIVNKAWDAAGHVGSLSQGVNEIAVLLDTPEKYKLDQQEYIIYDKNNKMVGEIPAPFLSSGQQ
jgi:hypothetical protein